MNILADKIRVVLGAGLIEFYSQQMTMAARAIADMKTFGHLP